MASSGSKIATVFVLVATSAFALKAVFAKLAYGEDVSLAALLLLRFLIAAPIFWSVAQSRGLIRWRELDRYMVGYSLIGGFLFFVSSYADFMAIKYVPVSLERTVLFTYPAFVLVLAAFRDRTWPTLKFIGVFIVSELGVAMTAGLLDDARAFEANLKGIAWASLAAIAYAIYIVQGERVVQRAGSPTFAVLSQTSVLFWFAWLFFSGHSLSELALAPMGHVYVVCIALICTVIPYFLFFEGVKRLGSGRSSLVAMIGPTVASLVAYLVLDERLSWTQIAGMGVTLGSMMFLMLPADASARARALWRNRRRLQHM